MYVELNSNVFKVKFWNTIITKIQLTVMIHKPNFNMRDILWSEAEIMDLNILFCRGVSDVGFSIFADTDADADFAF